MIYLDNNATTKPYPSVTRVISTVLEKDFGNPSSTSYEIGRNARSIIDLARTNLADLLDCKEEEIIFNSGGTESIYSGLLGAARTKKYSKKIFISDVEHPAVVEAAKILKEIFEIEVHKFRILEILKDHKGISKITEDGILSCMLANNETGIVNPILCESKSQRTFFHADVVQAIGKIDFSFASQQLDAISLSAHKFGGPKGIGALILRKSSTWLPMITGGGQERGRRGGTENVALIAGMGEAAKIAKDNLKSGKSEGLSTFRDRFEEILGNEVKELKIVGKEFPRLPNTSCIVVPGIIGFEIVEELGQKRICISAGSACKTGTLEPSKNLLAMGYSIADSLGMLRISFGFGNTMDDCEESAQIIADIIKNHQKTKIENIKKILNE